MAQLLKKVITGIVVNVSGPDHCVVNEIKPTI